MMTGESDLSKLLKNMSPILRAHDYVFCCLETNELIDFIQHKPMAIIHENEGMTLVVKASEADICGWQYAGKFRCITLSVHSSLNAIGLTAQVSSALAEAQISANVLAAYHHDHIFVPSEKSKNALEILKQLNMCHI